MLLAFLFAMLWQDMIGFLTDLSTGMVGDTSIPFCYILFWFLYDESMPWLSCVLWEIAGLLELQTPWPATEPRNPETPKVHLKVRKMPFWTPRKNGIFRTFKCTFGVSGFRGSVAGQGVCNTSCCNHAPPHTKYKTLPNPNRHPVGLSGPLDRLNAILSLLQPLDRYRAPSAIGSAIGRPLSRPISHPRTGRSPQPPRSKPLRGLNRAIVAL